MIILGIEEDDQARATGAPGVPLSDAETARIRQVVAALVAPVPMFDILTIPMNSDEPSATNTSPESVVGFIVIAAPRSPQGRTQSLVNDTLRHPRRNGQPPGTCPNLKWRLRIMTGSQAGKPEGAYRADRAGDRRKARCRELAWVVVPLVPDLPGDFAISQRVFRQFQQDMSNRRTGLFTNSVYSQTSIGRRRLLANGTGTAARSPGGHHSNCIRTAQVCAGFRSQTLA
jgi:hypothetical protein